MNWRGSQAELRNRYVRKFDAAQVDSYDSTTGRLDPTDQHAYLADLQRVLPLREGMSVLDAGAGTGALCGVLARVHGLAITALEPAPAMLATLRSKPELRDVTTVEGFCDSPADRSRFRETKFDVIASRQLVNGLFDPLAAFANWHHWLLPGGAVAVIDGLYGRSAWTGAWQEEVDALPVAACQSTALVPYLLEKAGFAIEAVELMDSVNRLPATRTPRYLVVARRKP
jgi:SAM-dependent methyltransferase